MKKQGFTLVELIVVVTILAILATIGFVSYSGYLIGVRDTNRIASLTSMSDGLELYRTKNDLPDPDDSVGIKVNGLTIANQGYIGVNVLQTIEYSKAGKDPKDDTYYSYYLTDDKKHYQLMAFLEEGENLENVGLNSKSYAAAINYSIRHPKVYGKRLGILLDANNTPIQELSNIIGSGGLNITASLSSVYKAQMTDNLALSGSGNQLLPLKDLASVGGTYNSCALLQQKKKDFVPGLYPIMTEDGGIQNLYCNNKGLVAEWLFDDSENLGKDSSGNNHQLTSNNSNIVISDIGKIGKSLLSGGDGELSSQVHQDFSIYKEFSYSFWLKRNGVSSYQWPNPIINGGDNHKCFGVRTHNYNILLNFERGFSPFTGVGGTYTSDGSITIDDAQWHYITMAYDGNGMRTYEDGVLRYTESVLPLNPSQECTNMIIMRRIKGEMDNVRIYNRAITAEEVIGLYNEGISN